MNFITNTKQAKDSLETRPTKTHYCIEYYIAAIVEENLMNSQAYIEHVHMLVSSQ